jgi:hypothetical protein
MALNEHDISSIRDQLSSLVTGIESRIDARFAQVFANLSSSNSSISNLRDDIRRLEQRQSPITGGGGGRRRDSGLPIPAHSSGSGGVPNAMNVAVRQASLLENGARDVARYAQDLLNATNNIGGQLTTARALNTELRNLLQVARTPQGAGAQYRLREYVSSPEFNQDLDKMRMDTRSFARRLSQPGNIANGSAILENYLRTQGLISEREKLQTQSLSGRFDPNLPADFNAGRNNVRELMLSLGLSSYATRQLRFRGANVARRFTTPESREASVEAFLNLPEENLIALGRRSDILDRIRSSGNLNEELFDRLRGSARTAVRGYDTRRFVESLSATSVLTPGDLASQIERMRAGIVGGEGIDPRRIAALSGRITSSIDYIRQARSAGMPNIEAEGNLNNIFQAFGGRQGLRGFSESVGQELSEFQRRRLGGETFTEEEEEREATLVATMQQLISALSQAGEVTEASSQKTNTTIAGLISSVVGALSIQQFLMMRFVQQPYQYQTLPALGLMGSTGMMGETLSGAFGAQESVLQSYREFGVSASFGAGGALGSLPGLLRGNPLLAVGGAIAGSLVTGGLGIMNQDGLAKALAGDNAEKAFTAELGRRMLDAQKFSQEFVLPTMQARVNLGIVGDETGTAANKLGALAGPGARALGYDSVVVGQLLGASLSTLRPGLAPSDEETSKRLIDTISELEAFGVSKEMGMGLLSTLSAAGSEDYRESIARLALATSEDGDITNYTANVLVPALAKVVESRSIQNISKNSELVERETAGLFSFFKNSDTNLGKMLSANPEVMSRVFGMLDQVSETAIQDPALMLYLNRMGVSFEQVMQGDTRALMLPMQMFAQQASYDAAGKIDLNNMASISSLMGFLTMSGIGVSTGTMNIAAEMFSAIQQSNGRDVKMGEFTERLMMESPEHRLERAFAQFSERMTKIAGSEGAEVTTNIVTETNTFFSLMSQNMASILEIQKSVQTVLGDTAAMSAKIAQAGIDTLTKLSEVTGIDIDTTELKRNYIRSYSNEFQRRVLPDVSNENVAAAYNVITQNKQGANTWSYSPGGGLVFSAAQFNVGGASGSIGTEMASWAVLGPAGRAQNNIFNIKQTEEYRRNLEGWTSNPERLGQYQGALPFSFGGKNFNFLTRDQVTRMFPERMEEYKNFVRFMMVSELSPTHDELNANVSLRDEYRAAALPIQDEWSTGDWATGGYTGIGSRVEPVGVVHGGEYVISDNNISGNLATLERIQAGERFDENSPFSMSANTANDTIRVMLEFSNTEPEQIINAARRSAIAVLREERLI